MKHLKKILLIVTCCAIVFAAFFSTCNCYNTGYKVAGHYDNIIGPV